MMDYDLLTDWSIHLAPVFLLPIGIIVLFYKHLPRFKHGLVYALNHALAWAISGTCLLLLVVSPFLPSSEGNFFSAILMTIAFAAAVQFAILVFAWLACRLFRGKVLINDGTLCETCGYNLTGNLSGKCPECGSSIESAELNPIFERRT